jgi:hypothetical protein
MTLLRRLALVASIVLCASLAFTAAANAAGGKGGGPGPLAPGDYVTTVTRADALFVPQGPGPQLSVNAVTDFESFQPEQNHDRPPTTTNTTNLFVQLFSPSGFGGGCFLIQPSALTIGKDLQSAHLEATVDANTPTCPGPPPGQLPLPIKVKLTWTGLGVVSKGHDRSTLQCAGYATDAHTNSLDGGATASGTVSIFGQPDVVFDRALAGLHSFDTHMSASGVQKPACIVSI